MGACMTVEVRIGAKVRAGEIIEGVCVRMCVRRCLKRSLFTVKLLASGWQVVLARRSTV